ncbi:MAG TPA: hypothetical protein VMT61_00440 [Candidatus Binataceae bacterium]|nr:hypothetical protein [Candidatus Binataceae bacterium]
MSKTLRAFLSITISLALCLSVFLLSVDLSVLLVPAGIVGLFIVNVDPILEAVMNSSSADEVAD